MEVSGIDAVIDAEQRSFGICGVALRRLREAKGMTQLQLAEASGVDASTINQAERGGRRRVRALTLARLADALEVAPGELLVDAEAVELAGREVGDG